ncbi:MAG: hypothetical protein HY851_11560 [candidate division Zixibacteria bacterium]|nr:hypothetical protein [candidate division Zixibacteria bacterium]
MFFGIAIGIGVAALARTLYESLSARKSPLARPAVYACGLLVLLPAVGFSRNYYHNDRSNNRIAYNYAYNTLACCDKDAVLFTSGDNDTYPLWAMQEVFDFRKDVRVVNLSLLGADWYIWQRKEQFGVPIPLSRDQILIQSNDMTGRTEVRPPKSFMDRARGEQTYLMPRLAKDRIVTVPQMLVDEVVLENRWKYPLYFSAPPYRESPLKLADRAVSVGLVYRLDKDPAPGRIDVNKGFELFTRTFINTGYASSKPYRDENATNVLVTYGYNTSNLYDELIRTGDTARALELFDTISVKYPEYWQLPLQVASLHDARHDSARAEQVLTRLRDTLAAFHAASPTNLTYISDYGMILTEIGKRHKDQGMIQAGIALMWQGFEGNPNSALAFRKLVSALGQTGDMAGAQKAARMIAEYKINQNDGYVQRLSGITPPSGIQIPEE